eukprot:symbB.v1.2.033735.t1/scaffold4019.1/size63226/3
MARKLRSCAFGAALLLAFSHVTFGFLFPPGLPRRGVMWSIAAQVGLGFSPVWAKRPEGVNRPELLPKSDGASTPIIDVARILTASQERQLTADIAELEQLAKVRLRVLTQTFPNTPGLAIKDYWKPDGRTIIYVHDTGGLGETAVVNFNAGQEVESMKPLSYWRQVQNTYGNKYYIKEHGDSDTVVDVVKALKEGFIPEQKS